MIQLPLAGLLWGDSPEIRAHNSLCQSLTNLQHLVGSSLTITRQTVAFDRNQPYWLDVERFETDVGSDSIPASVERLREVVELYRGDFLEGFYVQNALPFEEWSLAQRARLRELALQALHTLVVYYCRQGQAGVPLAITYATRLLALEPWREEAHRQLMLLLALCGQRSAALAQYDTCRGILAEELGVEPAAETMALYERIRAGELSPTPETAGRFAPLFTTLPPFLSVQLPDSAPAKTFVARTAELARLSGWLELVLTRQGRVAFVSGETDQGKTALLQAFARKGQQEYPQLLVAAGNCTAYGGIGDPYMPFRDILRLLTGDIEAQWVAGTINYTDAHRLWALLPEAAQALAGLAPDLISTLISGEALLARVSAATPEPSTWLERLRSLVAAKAPSAGSPTVQPPNLFEQYTKFLHALARRVPLLLILDDLQWVDSGSLSLLFHLGRRLAGSRILILAAYRSDEAAMRRKTLPLSATPAAGYDRPGRHPLEAMINQFRRDFGDIVINLDQTAGRDFVEAFLDSEPNQLGARFRATLYRQTDGQPLFTTELVRAMQERGDLRRDETGVWVEGKMPDWNTLPARVEGLIGERLRRLNEPLRELLRVACVEGETFTAEVVAHVLGLNQSKLDRQLRRELADRHRLVQADRLIRSGDCHLTSYRFRHVLTQKYLYTHLPEAERVLLHENVGQALEALYGAQTEEVAVQLAWHYQAAGLVSKAVTYLYQAGTRAARRAANVEAIEYLTRGLALLETGPDTSEQTLRKLDFLTVLEPILLTVKGYGGGAGGGTGLHPFL